MTGIVRKQERLLKRADITEDGIDYNDIKWEGMWVSPLVFFLRPVDQYDYIKAMKLKEKNKREKGRKSTKKKRISNQQKTHVFEDQVPQTRWRDPTSYTRQ